ncbi:hypothetical protein [Stenotrophomonas phage BUCT609]|uniref:Uncharacterized protein n=1 Tax=Stenotrophomonas phage BUCT609 TaxID=2834250 RepID=A0A8E6PL68_9CAUD|nr:hypothetical protein [Stenotrophomonas phage BUCT609]
MSNRKAYIIGAFRTDRGVTKLSDVLWHSTVQRYNNESHPTESVSGARLLTMSDKLKSRDVILNTNYGVILRRAHARKILAAAQQDAGTWGRGISFRIIEVGEFDRTVRPVKHWNIERQHRNVDATGQKVKVLGPWSKPVLWTTGYPLREEARAEAKALEEMYAGYVVSVGEQFKFTAVPVYADKE